MQEHEGIGVVILVPDVRTKEEVALIHELGGKVFLVTRNGGKKDEHFTERGVDEKEADYIIRNDSSLEALRAQVSLALQSYSCPESVGSRLKDGEFF
jgi:hypothetical protein